MFKTKFCPTSQYSSSYNLLVPGEDISRCLSQKSQHCLLTPHILPVRNPVACAATHIQIITRHPFSLASCSRSFVWIIAKFLNRTLLPLLSSPHPWPFPNPSLYSWHSYQNNLKSNTGHLFLCSGPYCFPISSRAQWLTKSYIIRPSLCSLSLSAWIPRAHSAPTPATTGGCPWSFRAC